MKFLCNSKHPLASALMLLAAAVCAQTSVAQVALNPGFVVTPTDDLTFLGETLFPDSQGNPFRFDGAILDFGEDPFGEDAGERDSIGTFINNSGVFGIGDPGNTVRTGIAISSGLVQDFGGGPNTQGNFSTDFDSNASDEQISLLNQVSPSAFGDFQDTTSLTINFTNVT